MPWSVNRRAAKAVALHDPNPDPAARIDLMDKLGLLTGGRDQHGRRLLAPDDLRANDIPGFISGGEDAGGMSGTARAAHYQDPPDRPETYTSPPALRAYAERAAAEDRAAAEQAQQAERAAKTEAPKAERPPRGLQSTTPTAGYTPNGRPTATCGTLGGRSRHTRLNEPVCQPCKDAHKAWSVANRRKKAAGAIASGERQPFRRPVAECGTPSGKKRHYREGTKVCEACKEAARIAGRYYWHLADDRRKAAKAAEAAEAAEAAGRDEMTA